MHQTVLMNADVDEGSEVGDVGDDTRQYHSLFEVVDGGDILVELKPRVTTRLLQFLHDISKGRDTDISRHILFDIDGLSFLLIINKVCYSTALILRHLLYDGIALRMDGRVVERVLGTRDTKEACTLLESRRSQTRHLLQLGTRSEGTVLTSVVHDVLGERRTKPADIHQQMLRSRIEVDAHAVHTTLDGLIQRVLELCLVYIVLILSDTDALGIDLGSISRRPMETAPRTVTSSSGNSSRAIFEAE